MGCHVAIAQSILDAGADYLLAVKDNQPTLHAEIESYGVPGRLDGLRHTASHRLNRGLSAAGATEAIMLAHGCTSAMLDALVRDGLATAERRAVRAGRRPIQVTWFAITDAGRP